MTVNTSNYRIEHNGNGSTTVFAYNFRILDQAHIEVILVDSAGTETVQALTTNYTVSGVGNTGGGNITMVTAPATGSTLVLRRSMPFTQDTDYTSGDPFPAETHEEALDELTMNDQEQQEVLGRTLKAPKQDAAIADLPIIANRNDKLITFDSNGDPIATDYTNAQLATAVAASTTTNPSTVLQVEMQTGSQAVSNKFTLQNVTYTVGANNLFVYRNGQYLSKQNNYTETSTTEVTLNFAPNSADEFAFLTNPVTSLTGGDTASFTHQEESTTQNLATYLQSQHDTTVNVRAYGAKGDGVTDDTLAIIAASDALQSNGRLFFPPGDYVVDPDTATRTSIIYINGLANVTISGYGAKLTTDDMSLVGNAINLIALNNSTRVVIEGLNLDINISAVAGCTGEIARLIFAETPVNASAVCEDVTMRDLRLSIRNNSPQGDWGADSAEGDSLPIPEGDTYSGLTNKFKLEGIYFLGDNTNNYPHKNITVDSCRFDEMTARSFWVRHCEDVFFVNNSIYTLGGRRPQVRCIISNKNLKIDNNTFIDANSYSDTDWIYCNRQSGRADNGEATISNNTFHYGRGTCVELDAFSNSTVANNVFRVSDDFDTADFDNTKNHGSGRGIRLSQNESTSGICENITITGNVYNGGDVSGTDSYPVNFIYAVSLDTGAPLYGITITGNSILDCGTPEGESGGIVLSSIGFVQSFTITGNTFHNNSEGLALINAFKGVISGNTFSGVGGVGNGIDIASSGYLTNVLITGNNFNDLNRGINATSGTWPTTYRVLVDSSSGTFTGTLTGGTSGATATISSDSTFAFNQANYDRAITVTGATGFYDPGETVTAGGGGTGTVTCYFPGSEQLMILNNTFTNVLGVGIRNYGSGSPIYDNLFINTPSQLQTPGGLASFTASNNQKVI